MKHWVFDLDCTLVDSGGLYEKAIKEILTSHGVACTAEQLKAALNYFHPGDFFRLYLPSEKIDEAIEALLRINHEQVEQINPYEGIADVLEILARNGVMISVWTGRELATASRILDRTGLSKFVERCVSRTCTARTKPHPDGLLKILEASRHEGNEIVMVGDHEYDIKGARAVGAMAINVSWGAEKPHELAALSDRHFYSVRELRDWVASLYSGPI